jgi:hypothetical protein
MKASVKSWGYDRRGPQGVVRQCSFLTARDCAFSQMFHSRIFVMLVNSSYSPFDSLRFTSQSSCCAFSTSNQHVSRLLCVVSMTPDDSESVAMAHLRSLAVSKRATDGKVNVDRLFSYMQ